MGGRWPAGKGWARRLPVAILAYLIRWWISGWLIQEGLGLQKQTRGRRCCGGGRSDGVGLVGYNRSEVDSMAVLPWSVAEVDQWTADLVVVDEVAPP